jgi:hypothetical protein
MSSEAWQHSMSLEAVHIKVKTMVLTLLCTGISRVSDILLFPRKRSSFVRWLDRQYTELIEHVLLQLLCEVIRENG